MWQRLIIFLSLNLAIYGISDAQSDSVEVDEPFKSSLNLIAKSYGDSIVLRWAPDKPGAWAYANEVGYTLERTTLTENQETFDPDSYQQLNTEPLKPWPLAEWEKIVGDQVSNDSYAAVAAQAVYGKSFSSSAGAGATILDQADEFMNRFSFSLLAADFSADAALALGLRYHDDQVQPDQNYIYRVFVSTPSPIYAIDTAYFVIKNTPDSLPAPEIERIVEGDKALIINWNRLFHSRFFSAYHVERSFYQDKNFTRLTNIPFLNPKSDNLSQPTDNFIYTDSVSENYIRYYYRIVGITPFAEYSKPSEPIAAMAQDRTPPPHPKSVSASPLAEGIVQVNWSMEEDPADLLGYFVGRSSSLKNKFLPLHDEPLPPSTRSFVDSTANFITGNYYMVAALDTSSNASKSSIVYAAIEDSIPPAQPTGLAGIVDTTGIVTLNWQLGDEADLAGYMVLFSNDPEHVFVNRTQKPIADTTYTDTIQVKTLTEKVYYKIRAVDTRFNQSENSDMLTLQRPDLIAPTPPVFSNYEVRPEGIYIEWVPSSSEDVTSYVLYRKDTGSVMQQYITFAPDTGITSFVDKFVTPGITYEYGFKAIDDAGLASRFSGLLRLKMLDLKEKPAIDDLSVLNDNINKNIVLDWSYDPAGEIERYEIYRAIKGEPFSTYTYLESEQNQFIDQRATPGVAYEYTVKALYKNGRQSPFSNIVIGQLE